jgi:purine-binding chemotaxis protein CheW
MNRCHSDHALQDYFDDLLEDASASPGVGGEASPPETQSSSVQPAAQPPAADPLPYADHSFAALEQTKREKLQALLNSKPLTEEPAVAPVLEDPTPQAAEVPPAPATVIEKVVQPEKIAQAEKVIQAAPAIAEPSVAEPDVSPVSQYLSWHDNGRPHWAQGRFDALLFDVAGLTLAVPLIALGQIQPLTDELTPLFGQAAWFMGLLPTPAGKIRTVNTALFVMPEKYDSRFLETAKYVVSIDGVPWGLAVDAINQPISLDPDDVKWRSERSKRPWLAGTVKSAMCALIDIPQMGKMLTDADANAKRG